MQVQIENALKKKVAIEWLWHCKLKSRDSFLMILEFITPIFKDYKLSILYNMLSCLSKTGGNEFFILYVINNNQFVLTVDRFNAFEELFMYDLIMYVLEKIKQLNYCNYEKIKKQIEQYMPEIKNFFYEKGWTRKDLS